MPRPKRPGAPEPKRRSRKGCWPCKARKVKCGEEKPSCLNCQRQGEVCDYSVRLNWGGRSKFKPTTGPQSSTSHLGNNVLSFADPPTESSSFVQAESNTQNGASLGIMTRRTPYSPEPQSVGMSPMAVSGQSQDRFRYSSKEPSAALSPSSQLPDPIALSPRSSTVLPQDVVPRYHPSLQRPVDGMSYPSPAGTSSSVVGSDDNASRQPASVSLSAMSPPQQDASPSSAHSSVAQEGFLSTSIKKSIRPGNRSLHYSSSDKEPTSLLYSRPSALTETSDQATQASTAESKWRAYLRTVTDNYGLDRGRPDLDLNRNNDHAAIDVNYALDLISSMWKNEGTTKSADRESEPREQIPDRSRYAYYASPVPVNIPRCLSPLPSSLLENPINLMYFHFFINKTATLLVPHDCGHNPFVSVMPSMAIGDPDLLNLMLAYSASHRARYLEHPEPANRIALWVRNVFPALRLALEGPHGNITDSHLATAIMLLSLKIISPSTFEVPIPWQSHLKLARDLFLARGGIQMAGPGNHVGAFLARWLCYLDISGILSCRHSESPSPSTAYHYITSFCRATGGFDESCVDCFSGFTTRTTVFLARLGQLTHRCDNERFDDTGNFRVDWSPSADMLLEGQALLREFGDPYEPTHINWAHYRDFEAKEILAINQAFRCAGLLHLHRRVLDSPLYSPLVAEALNGLVVALNQIKPGGAAEVGVLFPLFTAGCETRDPQLRAEIMGRIVALERTGMKQILNARKLMQRCWDEDLPWIALAQGEFLG